MTDATGGVWMISFDEQAQFPSRPGLLHSHVDHGLPLLKGSDYINTTQRLGQFLTI